jgi:mannose-6-phosphate isomerase-like protein (cupin superfamily)
MGLLEPEGSWEMAVPLTKASVSLAASSLAAPYRLVELGMVDAFVVRAFMAHGEIIWHKHMDQDESFLVWRGEMAAVPRGILHRPVAEEPCVILTLGKGELRWEGDE